MTDDVFFKAVHTIIVTGHAVTDGISSRLKPFGITEPQFNVLRTLKEAGGGPLTVQEILDGMVQKSSNITRIVDKLISKGYVERKERPDNRRKMDITMTAKGAEGLKLLEEKVYEMYEPMVDNLTTDELQQLQELITRLIKH